jgi:hypothetical protein
MPTSQSYSNDWAMSQKAFDSALFVAPRVVLFFGRKQLPTSGRRAGH